MFIHPGELATGAALESVRVGFESLARDFVNVTGETFVHEAQAMALDDLTKELASKEAEVEAHEAYHGFIGKSLNFAQTQWVEHKLKKLLKR